MKRRSVLIGGPAALLSVHRFAAAAQYPQKPITFVVPGPPGGTTDLSARLVSDGLSRALGEAVIVDYKPGANGSIASQQVARARADGHTLLVAYNGFQVGTPHLVKNLSWDPLKDFVPVAMLTRAPQLMAVRKDLPVTTLKELIAYARANPGKLNYGTSGAGSIQHIAGELFSQAAGAPMTHVAYRGAAQAVQDMLGGNVDLVITTPASLIALLSGGRCKPIAVTGTERLAALPAVPTAAEAGLPGFVLDSWFALYAPAGTPPDVVALLNREINKLLASPEVAKRADAAATSLELMSPSQLGEFTASEYQRWGKIIRDAGITLS